MYFNDDMEDFAFSGSVRAALRIEAGWFGDSDAPTTSEMRRRVREVLALVGTPPCDQGCPHRQLCAKELLACSDFTAYVNDYVSKKSGGRSRNPSRHRYESIFFKKDESLSKTA